MVLMTLGIAIRLFKLNEQLRSYRHERESSILGTRSSKKLSGWLPKAIWSEQALERALWLSQTLPIRNRYVSSETVAWWTIKSKKLQRTSW